MTVDQTIVFGVIFLALVLFMFEWWRYDIVALLALLVVTVTGVIPRDQVFSGFGHPAVVVVAAILVVSRGLCNSGAVDLIGRWLLQLGDRPMLQVGAVTGLVTSISGFISSVGAAAILIPVATQMGRKSGRSPSYLLMPLAAGSLLGAMITLIGSAPNIIIAMYRARTAGEPFGMFDYTPVGLGVALAGFLFISLIGWRLIPQRKGQASREELFHIQEYMTEVRVPEDSKIVGKLLRELEAATEAEVTVVGLVRGEWRVAAPSRFEILRAGDILVVEADSEALGALVDAAGLELGGSKELREDALGSDDVSVVEAVVMPASPIVGNTAYTLNLRWRYGVNLLGVARQGARLTGRLRSIRLRAGDVLLLQGETEVVHQALTVLGCLPLAERGLRLGLPRRVLLAVGIFVPTIAVTAMDLVPVETAFVVAAVAMVLFNLLSIREVYESIEWPVIILIGAMIPVGEAMEITGGAGLIATGLLSLSSQIPPVAALATVLLGTMALTPLINNAATAVLMAPIAIGVAQGLGASADPFLMAVAIGASCDFLTPIGHQSNTLVMGPGGYRFGDYWRMGLPLTIIVVVVSLPLILWFWPLGLGNL